MINQKTVELASNNINALIDFVHKDNEIMEDFQSYLQMIGFQPSSQVALNKVLMPYIFERKIISKDDEGNEIKKSIIDIYLEKKSPQKDELDILNSLNENISSVFKIDKLFKTGFNLLNIVNEKEYSVYSMVKMTNLRGVGVGQFLVSRIFKVKNEYYMIELNEIIPSSQEEKAYRLAVAKQIQDPSLLYAGNESKEAQIKEQIAQIGDKFEEFFGKKQIITLNKEADELLSAFNEFIDNNETITKKELKDLIKKPTETKFFQVSSNNADFVQTAAQGFSAEGKSYDIGIVYDETLGLFVIPFLNTFNAIFNTEDPSSIEGYKECVKDFLQNDKIPPFILKKAYSKNSKKFLSIVKESTGEKFSSLKAINQKYKPSYLATDRFSSTTVLYLSSAFNHLMGFAEKQHEKSQLPEVTEKIGRNEPCPCGSGKKYKKCCSV